MVFLTLPVLFEDYFLSHCHLAVAKCENSPANVITQATEVDSAASASTMVEGIHEILIFDVRRLQHPDFRFLY